jgi:hypothetical protein
VAREPEIDGEGWTLRALKQYVEQRFDDTKDALDKAEDALEYRLESMNQFRQQIERERGNYVTLDKHDDLANKIDEIRRTYVSNDRLEALDAKTAVAMKPINDYMASQIGHREGVNAFSAILYSLVALAVSFITAIILYYERPRVTTPPAQIVTITVPASTTSSP